MTPEPLQVECPSCGCREITYTCEPDCCFNHLCAACYTTFELVTLPLGQTLADVQQPLIDRDPMAPTVACACCASVEVYMLTAPDGAAVDLVCMACQARLKLVLEAVQAG
jgi:hypothetical protein